MILKKQHGVTILEILLVLAISAAIITLVLNRYQSWVKDTNVEKVKNNVDMMFLGAMNFYRANCIQYKIGSQTKIAKLDEDTTRNVYVPDEDEITNFIKNWPFPFNPLVDSYYLQFNRTSFDRTVDFNNAHPPDTYNVGTIYLWSILVAVKLNPDYDPEAYRALLGADCLSNMAGGTIKSCSANQSGNYLVWERLPSGANLALTTQLPNSDVITTQFTQMYTTYPILTLTNGLMTDSQHYLCGG